MIKWFLIGGLVGIFLKELFKQLHNEIRFWRELDAEVIEELLQMEREEE